jgi:hypothetical protein
VESGYAGDKEWRFTRVGGGLVCEVGLDRGDFADHGPIRDRKSSRIEAEEETKRSRRPLSKRLLDVL